MSRLMMSSVSSWPMLICSRVLYRLSSGYSVDTGGTDWMAIMSFCQTATSSGLRWALEEGCRCSAALLGALSKPMMLLPLCTISHGSSSTPSDDCLTACGPLYAEGGGLSGNWKLPAGGEVGGVAGTEADGLPTSPLPAPCRPRDSCAAASWPSPSVSAEASRAALCAASWVALTCPDMRSLASAAVASEAMCESAAEALEGAGATGL
mmetsp:Transcript_5393/g.15440  ORF Transcript_5393/g.15440 Transcript_5393/m.15440 type:complete len:208 (-) Transcript_5393:1183-1806(-)